MKPLLLTASVLLTSLVTTVDCFAERKVIASVPGEMNYTIANQHGKYIAQYPYIVAVDPERSGEFIAYENLIYKDELALDLYTPKQAFDPAPLVLLIHGGGWRSGDKKHFKALAKYYAE